MELQIVDNDTWYESPLVTPDEFTIAWIENQLVEAKKLGGTEFRTITHKKTKPFQCGIVTFTYKDEE